MRISAIEEYGLRCLVTLAREGTKGMLSIADMAEREGLSVPYTSKLLSILRKAGLVTAERGRGGGFSIARDPAEIDLYEVITALGGPIIDPDHCSRFSGQREECVHAENCTVHDVLGGLAGYIQEFLSRTTVADLIATEPIIELRPRGERVEARAIPATPKVARQANSFQPDAEN
ncbi:MAG: Rrf2 family transcriptional regulator [candidate division Zixibacteria bacterium]|jgi:Rrf2 family protein|nr:Rrf2 family transcriptional regulator [candidate division Zixibacteria bacterium]